jgi:hypothetical protein
MESVLLNSTRQPSPFQRAQGHQQGAAFPETHDLTPHPPAVAADDAAVIADGKSAPDSADLHQQADDGADPAVNLAVGQAPHFVDDVVDGDAQPVPPTDSVPLEQGNPENGFPAFKDW